MTQSICLVCNDVHYDTTSCEECDEAANIRWPWMPASLRFIVCLLEALI